MARILIIQPNGGLYSRLRTVIGALAYTRATDRKLCVSWMRYEPSESMAGGVFDCKLGDLYSGDFEECDWSAVGHWCGLSDGRTILAQRTAKTIRLRSDKLDPFVPYIDSNAYKSAYESLIPTDELNRAIDEVSWPTQGKRVVGVHVRHSMKAAQSVACEWYFRRLDELEKCIGMNWLIYLACDAQAVEDAFRSRYPANRLMMLKRDYKYDHRGIISQCAGVHHIIQSDWAMCANHSTMGQHVALVRGARYVCDSNNAGHVVGGRYEDSTCPVDPKDLLAALG